MAGASDVAPDLPAEQPRQSRARPPAAHTRKLPDDRPPVLQRPAPDGEGALGRVALLEQRARLGVETCLREDRARVVAVAVLEKRAAYERDAHAEPVQPDAVVRVVVGEEGFVEASDLLVQAAANAEAG